MRLLSDPRTIAAHEAEAIRWDDEAMEGIALVDGVRVRYWIVTDGRQNYDPFPDVAFINDKDLPLIKPTSEVQRMAIIKAQDSGKKFKLQSFTPMQLKALYLKEYEEACHRLNVTAKDVREFGAIVYSGGSIDIFGYC